MAAPELIEFIRQGFAKGVSREQITRVLQENNWQLTDINAGFDEFLYGAFSAPGSGAPPAAQRTPNQIASQPVEYISDPAPKHRVSTAIVSTSLFLGIVIILGGSLIFTQNLWVPTAASMVSNIEEKINPAFFGNPSEVPQVVPATATNQTEGVTVDGPTNDTQREADIHTIEKSLNAYFNNQNTYPDSLSDLVPNYLSTMPIDPFTHAPYTYTVSGQGSDFMLCAQLSTGSDYCTDEVGDYTSS